MYTTSQKYEHRPTDGTRYEPTNRCRITYVSRIVAGRLLAGRRQATARDVELQRHKAGNYSY